MYSEKINLEVPVGFFFQVIMMFHAGQKNGGKISLYFDRILFYPGHNGEQRQG